MIGTREPTEPAEPVASPRATVRELLHRRPWGEVVALVLAAAVVQVAFTGRTDWPAHLLAGGGAVLVVVAVAPTALHRWAAPVAIGAVTAVGVLSEVLWVGPFDPLDIAFTVVGGLFVASATPAGPEGQDGTARATTALVGVALVGLAVFYRYGVPLDQR